MSGSEDPHNLFHKPDAPMLLGDAVAAVIVDENDRYLMQLRDDKPGIFYPAHWGLFGGAIEEGETDEEALRREIREELHFTPESVTPLQELTFDLRPMGGGNYWRRYFEVPIKAADIETMTLGEGEKMRLFRAEDVLTERLVTPYDSFAVWLHYAQRRNIIQP